MAIGLLIGFVTSKNFGVLFGGVAYGLSGYLAIAYVSWWALLIGVIATFILRFLGFDPAQKYL